MLLSEPGRTDYDINFTVFGFPIRTHPAFFIMPILLGRGLILPDINTGVGWLLLIAIFWVSILIHELGHAFAYKYFGLPCRIVLYWMGGLAIADSGAGVWGRQGGRNSLDSNQRIVVSLAGPVFGFLLAAVLWALVYAVGGQVLVNRAGMIPIPVPILEGTIFAGKSAILMVIWGGIILNIFLNVLNLFPIFPLDGGQALQQLMVQMDSSNGLRNSIYVSIATAILVAVFSFQSGDRFLGFFFGFMAFSNYQMLQQLGGPRW